MSGCFSLAALKEWCSRSTFHKSGLRHTTTDIGDGTVMSCWVPLHQAESKPDLILLHGIGTNAIWQWVSVIPRLVSHFNLYVPDLVFFGGSYSTRPDRSDWFQADCVKRVVDELSISEGDTKQQRKKVSVVGLSYGGFVAYRMAVMFPEEVGKVVICCAGVCMEERDIQDGVFRVADLEAAADILIPQTPDKLRELIAFTLYRPPPPKMVPSCLLKDFINVMCRDNLQERRDLIREIPRGRRINEIPKISQPTLIIWGEQDQIFPLELGHRLKRHIGENAELVVIKNAGHIFNVERPKEFCKHLKAFLINDSLPAPPSLPVVVEHRNGINHEPPPI